MNDLVNFISTHGTDKTYWIAYSGGLDSHVLLSLCGELCKTIPLKLRAIHVNHQLSRNANKWSQHCENICKNYHIDLTVRVVSLSLNKDDSLEEVARVARHQCFAECLEAGDILLTAHHQDDQAETVLLQLLRGAGLKGLAAMPELKRLGNGWLGRPLLNLSRKSLQQYAIQEGLQWIEDESNDDLNFTRNFLRHDIIPRLEKRWPTIKSTVTRSARHSAEAQALLEELSLELSKNVIGSKPNTLSVSKLLILPEAKQRLVLRSWINCLAGRFPSTKKLKTIGCEVLSANPDRLPRVMLGHSELRRYRDDLYLLPLLENTHAGFEGEWHLNRSLAVSGVGTLWADLVPGAGLKSSIASVQVRFRQGGERVTLPGRGRHTLKNLFQEWNVPTWERDRIPLLYIGDRCIGAVGYFIDPDFSALGREEGWVPQITSAEPAFITSV